MSIKKILLYVVGVLVAVSVVTGIFIYIRDIKMAEGTVSYNMYYLNGNTGTLGIDTRTVNLVESDDIMFKTVVDEFQSGPKSSKPNLLLPPEFKIKDRSLLDKIARIDVEPSFDSLNSGSKALCLDSLVYTITDMSFVDSVSFYVDGKPYMTDADGKEILFNRNNVRNNPVIEPEKTQWKMVTLYFADKTATDKLAAEQKRIEVKQSLTLEYQIVEQLILGPGKTMLRSVLPHNTEIIDIKTENNICYVNLSKSFMNINSGDKKEAELSIYSVVNSLTEIPDVKKVQFLIEGEKVDTFSGIDFSKAFERNDTIIR